MLRKEITISAAALVANAPSKTVILIGDFCLDVYYHISSADLEPSVETGLMVRKVSRLQTSLGGGGNVFANLAALGAGKIIPFGVIGPDMFGIEMMRLMEKAHPGCDSLFVQEEGWVTPAYMKPILDGAEQERIDTGLRNSIKEETVEAMLAKLHEAVKSADIVMINQQLEGSIYTDRFIDGLNTLASENPSVMFIVDARSIQSRFHGMWHKLNTHEAALEAGIELDPLKSDLPADEVGAIMKKYNALTGDPLIVSRGQFGAMAYDGNEFYSAEGLSFLAELDTVGAGDSFFSGFALSKAAGLPIDASLNIGNCVAGVTVQKLHTTGTCTPEELCEIAANCDFTYNADTNIRKIDKPFEAEIIGEWEAICARPAIEYAVFDNDGTISTFREGWEDVMETCMIDAVTGGKTVSRSEREKIRAYCRDFIIKSTGIQTINQMVMLVDIVRKWGLVPEEEILTAKQYKDIYNTALLKHIHDRLERVRDGRLDPRDATLAGALDFLRTLSENGVKIYLASGTDVDDVKNEAHILGFDKYFTGGIFGSVGDVKNDPKRQVLRDILSKEGVDMEKLAIFGDGPVEMREARSNGALAVGVLSDEKHRYGWNMKKHSRLLYAGSDILIPDFSQYEELANFLLKR
ncbi:MAG: PfkB family carbohydrate kinase [Bacteroidales bacterium]|nr:PfkB family carbohydrate kinase [Bacteroidales bacterium]